MYRNGNGNRKAHFNNNFEDFSLLKGENFLSGRKLLKEIMKTVEIYLDSLVKAFTTVKQSRVFFTIEMLDMTLSFVRSAIFMIYTSKI